MKKIIAGLLLLSLLTGLSACQKNQSTQDHPKTQTTMKKETEEKSAVPTVYIHGYSGTINSFGGMIRRLTEEKKTTREAVITVEPDGSIQMQGRITQQKTNPSIQVLFAANQDNEWNQAQWIDSVLVYLKQQGVNEVNLVGHSMGGVSTLRFLMSNLSGEIPEVKKFVAIGAPFNEFEDTSATQDEENLLQNGPAQSSERYQFYQENSAALSNQISVLLIAGKLSEQTENDGIVPMTSALAPYKLLKENGNPVKELIMVGENAQHSQLHENKSVDQAVSNFLWK